MNEEMAFNELSPESAELRAPAGKINPAIFTKFFQYLGDENLGSLANYQVLRLNLLGLRRDGSIESFRKLEKILNDGNLTGEARDFALTALNFCRFKIENNLLNFPVDPISGGLGGEIRKLDIFLQLQEQIKLPVTIHYN